MNSSLKFSQNSLGFLCLLLMVFMRRVVSCSLVYRSSPHHCVSVAVTRESKDPPQDREVERTDVNRDSRVAIR